MTIDVERIEALVVDVHDLEKAEELFSRLFGLKFTSIPLGGEIEHENLELESGEKVPDEETTSTKPRPISVDPSGVLELIETGGDKSDDKMRSIHFKVSNIDAAVAEMQSHGIRVVQNLRAGQLRETIFHPDDLFGVRICFIEYEQDNMVEALFA